MVRDSGISATRPIFPGFLLPTSFKFGFPRRHSASTTSSADEHSAASSPATTPGSSPPDHDSIAHLADTSRTKVARAAPDTLRCSTCSTDLAFASQIVSKGFTGRYGRAFLVAPPTPPAGPELLNLRVGKSENRQLVTGWHVVADISCATCSAKLGWKYVDAREQSQKYKVGKFILETERTVTFQHWEDIPGDGMLDHFPTEEGTTRDDVEFDSDDEDECEDIFAGTWDADVVAHRRGRMVAKRAAELE